MTTVSLVRLGEEEAVKMLDAARRIAGPDASEEKVSKLAAGYVREAVKWWLIVQAPGEIAQAELRAQQWKDFARKLATAS